MVINPVEPPFPEAQIGSHTDGGTVLEPQTFQPNGIHGKTQQVGNDDALDKKANQGIEIFRTVLPQREEGKKKQKRRGNVQLTEEPVPVQVHIDRRKVIQQQ